MSAPTGPEGSQLSVDGIGHAIALALGRSGTPEEVAAMAVTVLANGNLTGPTVQVNGGAYLM